MVDSTRIKFQYDLWCDNNTLKDSLPSVFRIASEKEASMADLMVIVGDMAYWNACFTWTAQDWEVYNLEEFFRLLYSLIQALMAPTGCHGYSQRKSIFSICSFYKALAQLLCNHSMKKKLEE